MKQILSLNYSGPPSSRGDLFVTCYHTGVIVSGTATPDDSARRGGGESPLVTVIILTRNRAGFLKGAVDSVLGQTYTTLELLIIDDASEDETPSIIDGFDDPRIRVLRNDLSRGIPAARNVGLREARGDLIAFLDDDDRFLPEKLRRQVKRWMERDPHPGLVCCGVRPVVRDPSGREHSSTLSLPPKPSPSAST